MKNFVSLIVIFFAFSLIGTAQGLRNDFLKNKKNHEEIVIAFNNLSEFEKKSLWIEKMDQLLSTDLPSQHKLLIEEIRLGLEKGIDEKKSKSFLNNAVKLAEITPLYDFALMFASLKDYNFNGKFIDNTKIPLTEINNISQIDLFENSTSLVERRRCTCRWCGVAGDSASTHCNPTSSGCGFLWLQPCTKTLIPTP